MLSPSGSVATSGGGEVPADSPNSCILGVSPGIGKESPSELRPRETKRGGQHAINWAPPAPTAEAAKVWTSGTVIGGRAVEVGP